MLVIKLHGRRALTASLHVSGTTLVGKPVKGLLMDYNRPHVSDEIVDFSEIAKACCLYFPAAMAIAPARPHLSRKTLSAGYSPI